MAYADNSTLMDKSHDGLRTLFDRLKEAVKKIGLQINKGKTEYLVVKRRDSMRMYPSLSVGNHEFNQVNQFKYLGSVLTKKNETEKEAERIPSINKCPYGFTRILGSRSLSREIDIIMYYTITP